MKQVALALCLTAGLVVAQPVEEGQSWSAIGARTLGEGNHALTAKAGWPGIFAGYQRGLLSNLDVGGHLGFIYAVEGLVTDTYPGMKLSGWVRYRLWGNEKMALAVVSDPGLFFTVLAGVSRWGLSIPVGLRLGIAASSAVGLSVSFDVPFWIGFGTGGGANFPLLAGGGVEYFLTSELALSLTARMGPTIRHYGAVNFGFEAFFGATYTLGGPGGAVNAAPK